MSSPEKTKLCVYCGTDVAHQDRHKNRHGQYVCLPCLERRDRRLSPLRWIRHRCGEWRTWLGYALVAALAIAIFFYFVLPFCVNALTSG
jgi:hypothetical protein